MCIEASEQQVNESVQQSADTDPQLALVNVNDVPDSTSYSDLQHSSNALPLISYCALLTNGIEQHWLEKRVLDEQQFRRYLNENYPFFICLYCKRVS